MPGHPRPGSEVEEELEAHLQMMAEELAAEGFSPEEARRRAEAGFGDLEGTRRYCRRQDRLRKGRSRMGNPIRFLKDELSLAVRTLARRPRSVLAPVLILALAIGLNTMVLTVVRSVLLAPLPFRDADRVVVAEERAEGGGMSKAGYPILDAWRRESRQVDGMTAFLDSPVTLLTGGGPIRAGAAMVTSGFFDLLEDPFRMGRGFTREEHLVGGPRVVAISEGLWERAFGSDPNILNRTVDVEGEEHSVVAVVRKGGTFPDNTEIWTPVEPANPELMEIAGAKILTAVAHLRPGVRPEAAGRELAEISSRVVGGAPEAVVIPLKDRLLGDVRTPLLLLQGAVFLVLLAAAANAGSLLLARGVRRRGEVALRASLGAGTSRVAVGLLMEGLVLGSAAGLLGLLLAFLGLGPALALVPVDLPRAAQISLNPTVALLAMVLAGGTGVATALVPAFAGSRTSPSETLRESTHGGGTPPWIRGMLEGLVVAQVALAVILTAGAGLLIRSFISTIQEDPGFHVGGITLVDVVLPDFRYRDQTSRVTFARNLLTRAENLPGTQAVALGRNLPISGTSMTSPLMVEGFDGRTPAVQVASVTAGYFDLMEIPFQEGESFTDGDRTDERPQIVLDPGVLSPDGSPLAPGQRAHSFFGDQEFRDVVGIVGAVRHRGLRTAPVPTAYEPFFQQGGSAGFTLLIRSDAPTAVVAREARALIRAMDPELAVGEVTTMDARIRRSLAEPRFYTVVLTAFGIISVLLALAGCQAGLAQRVAARRREIGIRMALGAPTLSVRGMILRRGLLLSGIGIALGLIAAIPGTRLLENQLYGVGVGDPLTFVLLFLILVAAGAVASDLPARQAASLDPADVLREG